jgi:hypothetical protein
MAIYSKFQALVNGVMRAIDTSTNTVAVQALQVNGSTSGAVTINATAITTPYSIVLPAAQGSANTTLVNDGSGNLVWTSSLNYDNTFEIINSADHTKGITFDASAIGTGLTKSLKMPNANVDLGNLTNSNINASAAIAYSKLNLSGSIIDADISSSAAIALSKLATVTASKVLVSNASGFVSASSTSTTTLGYLDISSSLTTLLSAKAPINNPTFTGTVAGISATMVGLGNVDNVQQLPMSYLDTDNTLAANSDSKVPSQKAIKYYVDNSSSLSANKDLSNLTSPTNINQDFIFNTGADAAISTLSVTTANIGGAHTKAINIATGNAVSSHLASSASSGDINLSTGTATPGGGGSVIHGNINLNANSGNITLTSGLLTLNAGTITTPTNIDMQNTGSITSMVDPTSAQDAATKNYVDNQDALKLSLTGGTMSGAIAMGASKITGLAAGSANGDAVRFEQAVLTDGSHAITGNQSFSSTAKIINLVDPTLAQDAATKSYVDSKIAGMSFKVSVETASLVDVTIASPGTIIGGYTVDGVGDRVLLMGQTDTTQNGIYLWQGPTTPMIRSSDADTWAKLVGAIVYVIGGTNAGGKFVCTIVDTGGPIDTTGQYITWTVFAAASSLDGVGTAGYNAYWTDTHTLAGEQFTAQSRGGFGQNVSAFSGVVKASAGVFSASALVNTDVSASAAIAYSKLSLTSSIVNADISSSAAIAESKLSLDYSTASLNTAIGTKVTANGAITGATKTKITYDAKGLVTAGADATTADIADSSNKRYVTDAELVVIGNTSGTNTGDQTITLTGDVTGTGTGSFSTTVNNAPKLQTSELANEALAATTLVALRYAKSADTSFVAGRMSKADLDASTVDNFYVIGLAYPASSVSAGGAVTIVKAGIINVPSHGFTVGTPVYLGASGAITNTAPSSAGNAIVKVGIVKDASNIDVQIQVMGIN